jgi:hypothetical protein
MSLVSFLQFKYKRVGKVSETHTKMALQATYGEFLTSRV